MKRILLYIIEHSDIKYSKLVMVIGKVYATVDSETTYYSMHLPALLPKEKCLIAV